MGKDKILHFIVGAIMGVFLSLFSFVGLFIGWAIIIGWEIWQGVSGTGTPEVMDIVFGIVPFTVVWAIIYFSNKKWNIVEGSSFRAMLNAYNRNRQR